MNTYAFRHYLNLLVKPRIFFMFSGKNVNFGILKGKMPFKMHKIIYFLKPFKMHKIIFFRKKIRVLTLPKIFRPVTRNTLIFYLALQVQTNLFAL